MQRWAMFCPNYKSVGPIQPEHSASISARQNHFGVKVLGSVESIEKSFYFEQYLRQSLFSTAYFIIHTSHYMNNNEKLFTVFL